MRNETKRNIKSGVFIFPKNWIELNSEKAARLENVAFLVEQGKCAVYYSSKEAYALDEVEEKEIRTLGKKFGFSENANIFGFVKNGKNVGNARIEKE